MEEDLTRINILNQKKEDFKKNLSDVNKKYEKFIKIGKEIQATPEGKEFFNLINEIFYIPARIRLIDNTDDNLFSLGKILGRYEILFKVFSNFINNK